MQRRIVLSLFAGVYLMGCDDQAIESLTSSQEEPGENPEENPLTVESKEGLEVATFAGGCFWCIEFALDRTDGVAAAISGYTGGDEVDPTYRQVASGTTGHLEAVQVKYDPSEVSYKQLLDIFWRQIDPTDAGGQFADRGYHYTTAIFYHNEKQKKLAEESKQALENSGIFDRPIVTRIEPAKPFYEAEKYHQDYSKKNPSHYERYAYGSGRKPFIETVWGEQEN